MYTLATSCEELTHWKRPWCWEGLEAGGEGDDRGWDGWMVSLTRCMWVWVNSGSWQWTGRPGVLWFMGSLRVRHNWESELNWCTQQREILGTQGRTKRTPSVTSWLISSLKLTPQPLNWRWQARVECSELVTHHSNRYHALVLDVRWKTKKDLASVVTECMIN